jgi:hypothetical protein
VFLAAGTEILTLWPTDQQLELVQLLSQTGSITWDACISSLTNLDGEVVIKMVRELIAGGFLALNLIVAESIENLELEVKHSYLQHA